MDENALSNKIIGSAIEVHKILGPGLLESAYQECLNYELAENGFYVLKEKVLPVVYKDIKLEHGYRVDLLVNEKVVVELKSVEEIIDLHIAQVLTYMKLGDYKLGLILNFNETTLRKGIKRLIR
jgi:GxxExxY protein